MAVIHPHIPKYRHYKPKNPAVVRIDGHEYYLGRYDSPKSHEKTIGSWSSGMPPARWRRSRPRGPGQAEAS